MAYRSEALGSQVRILSFLWLTVFLELSAGSLYRTALFQLLETRLSRTLKGSEEEEGGECSLLQCITRITWDQGDVDAILCHDGL